jgi:hypothetical protein
MRPKGRENSLEHMRKPLSDLIFVEGITGTRNIVE